MKSNNQGVKEETFIQTGRRGGGGHPGKRTRDKVVAGGPSDRQSSPEFQCGEIKPQTTDKKHLWGLRQQWEKLPASQERLLERPTGA